MIFIKRFFAWFWNPGTTRNKRGIVINDLKRRKDSRKLNKLIKQGKTQLIEKNGGKRCHQVRISSNGVSLEGNTK